ncbi:hypothetical protein BaRGS_00016792 [Batillaria attramentaria]|uniref:Ig-like domain-containing protein n=1 Tax=Batillaria attramentaria TaxID=370345 RepID=A0ABD0KY43_9CAEN
MKLQKIPLCVMTMVYFLSQPMNAAVEKTTPVMLGDNTVLTCPSLTNQGTIWMGPRNNVIAERGLISSTLDQSKYTILSGARMMASLMITDVTLQEDGVYRCLNADSFDVVFSTNVTVLVAVHHVRLIVPQRTINQGSEVSVTCISDGSKPAPDINWARRVAPTDPSLQADKTKYVDGDTAHFLCVTSGSRPAARVVWFISEHRVAEGTGAVETSQQQDEDQTFSVSSRLALFASRELDGADVICGVANDVMDAQGRALLNASVKLIVEFSPVVNITSSKFIVDEGEDVTFTCTADAEPPVLGQDIRLALDGKFLPESRLVRSGDKVTVSGISRLDRGNYQCVAKNTVGMGKSQLHLLKVRFAPVCLVPSRTAHAAVLGRKVSLVCKMAAYPHDVTVTWMHGSTNQTFLQSDGNIFEEWTEDVLESTLAITARAYEDIVCYAKNTMGESSNPCIFRLTPPVPPTPPENCKVLLTPDEQKLVACNPGHDGGSSQTFILRTHDDVSGATEDTLHAKEPRFDVTSLDPNKAHNVSVCAVSENFPDTPVCSEAVVLTAAPSTNQAASSAGVGSALYIALGVFVGFIVLLISIILFVIWRRRRVSSKCRTLFSHSDASSPLSCMCICVGTQSLRWKRSLFNEAMHDDFERSSYVLHDLPYCYTGTFFNGSSPSTHAQERGMFVRFCDHVTIHVFDPDVRLLDLNGRHRLRSV